MRMDSMKISLPPDLAEFVRRQVRQRYGNASEFFRELVRETIRREVQADLAFLGATVKGALPGATQEEVGELLAIQKKIRGRRCHCSKSKT